MRPYKWILLIVCILTHATGLAQGGKTASLRVDGMPDGTLEVNFEWGGNHSLANIFDGMSLDNGTPGQPALPTLSRLIILPRGTHLVLNPLTHEESILDSAVPEGHPLKPTAGPWIKDSLQPILHQDAKTYATDAYYRCGEPLEVEHLGTMGGSELYRITVRPVAYNPVRRSLKVSTLLNATLEKSGSSLLTPADSTLPERMLVVSRPQFRDGLQPFLEWKRQEGYDVEEIYADTNQRTTVKALIENHWEDADGRWPRYLLLVGDVSQIQSYIGITHPQELNNHATDLYYAEHTGDYLPDALVGRWPVNDTAQLRAVVEKTLRYEQCRMMDTLQLRRAILVAGKENSNPAPTTTNGQVNYIKGRLGTELPSLDTLCYYNPDSEGQRSEILGDIASGAAFLNYTAHCTTGGWSKPSVGFASIDTLGCSQPMLYVNNCCLSNAFDGTCFGEQLLRKTQGGAIGVIGATNSTLWNEDYYWAVGPKYPFSLNPAYDSLHPGAFDLFIGGSAATQGALLVAGNLSVTAFGSPYDKFYWETYCLLGDPSLKPYMGTPRQISLSGPDTVAVGTTSIRVSGTEGAVVSAVQGNQLLGTVMLDNHRSTELRFRQPADTLPIILTATMAQAIPAIDTINTAMPQGHAVTFRNVTVTDTTVDVVLVNLCDDTLYDVATHLLCDDTTLALFDALPQFADTLLPRAEQAIHIGFSVWKWEQRWSGILYAYSTTNPVDCEPLHLHGRLDGVPPSLSIAVLDADSSESPYIGPNTDYLLRSVVEGLCDSLDITLTAFPTGTTLIAHYSSPFDTFVTPDTISHLHVEAIVTRGNYSRSYDFWLTAGSRTDSFEEGLSSYPWDTTSMRPWRIDSTVTHTGAYSLRSAPIGGRQTSDLGLDLTLNASDSIAFWARTSSEQNYDKLTFYIDGVKQLDLSGNTGWRRCSYSIGAGSHRLLWRYAKDDSDNSGSDCAWIDDVELPAALWSEPYGWFGSIETVSIHNSATANGSLKVHPTPTRDIVWITSETVADATLLDILGRHLASFSLTAGQPHALDMGNLAAGIYIVKTGNGATTKIIKR